MLKRIFQLENRYNRLYINIKGKYFIMKSFIFQIRRLFSPGDKWKFVGITLLMALSALMELAGLGLLLGATTVFLSPGSSAGGKINSLMTQLLPGITGDMRVIIAVSAIALLLAAKNIFALLIVDIQAKFIFAKRQELASRLYKVFIHADYESYTRLPADFCIGSFTRITYIGNLVLLPAMQIVADLLVIAVLTASTIWLFPMVSLAGITFMLLAAAVTTLLNNRANKHCGEKFLTAELAENSIRQTGIMGEKTIKSAAKETFFLNRFDLASSRMNNLARKLYVLGQIPRLSLETAAIILACGVFITMLLFNVDKTTILLTFAVLTAVVGRILPALSRCNYNLTQIRQNYPLFELICDLLFNLPQEEVSNGKSADASQMIRFENITFAYAGKSPVFENFDLTIAPYSSLAVAGKSGRGKSTLADLLLGLLKPQSGKITAGSVDISSDLAGWREQIGVVPQNIFLLEGSVAENVAFGEEHIDFEKVKKCLALAGLEEFAPEYLLTANGNLSGGQKQRIGIARALYADAKLLILDEATSALDAQTENAFCEVLKELKGKVTMIVISHRESTLDACDKKLIL